MTYTVKIIDGQPVKIHTVIVHQFDIPHVDVDEDPDLLASDSLRVWENSEVGRWVIEHSVEPLTKHRNIDHLSYGYKYAVTAKIKENDLVYYTLKWK